MTRIKVRAVATGFYDGARRRPGEVFEVDADQLAKTKGKWFVPADQPVPPPVKRDPRLHVAIDAPTPAQAKGAAKRAASRLAAAGAVPELPPGDDGADLV